MDRVTENIYVQTDFRGCNPTFVTTKEGVVMIDTPMRPTDAMNWRGEISKWGEVRYLISTDPHIDHFLGNTFFPGVVIAHKGYREEMLKMPIDKTREMVKNIDPEGLFLMDGYQWKLPNITFTGSLNLCLGDHNFELMHLPGHTASLIGVYIPEERVAVASDCVFYQEKTWLHEALPRQWLASLKKLGELDVDIIIPGHGGVCKKEYLEEQAKIIRQWVKVVKSTIAHGSGIQEAIAKIVCPDPYPIPEQSPMNEVELNKMNVARLYHVLTAENGKI